MFGVKFSLAFKLLIRFCRLIVQYLALIELIFLLVPGTVLCFGFRITLIIHWCFSCCCAVLTLLRTFQRLMLCQRGVTQKARRKHCQDSWLEMPEGIFHTTEGHTQYINWGDLAERGQSLLGSGWASVRGWWAVVLCISSHFGGFIPLSFVTSLFVTITIFFIFCLISGLKLFLFEPTDFSVFQFSSPSHWGRGC